MTPLVRRRASLVLAGLAVAALALVAIRYWPRPALADEIGTSTAVFDRNGRLLRVTLAADGQYRLWTPLDRMPADLVDLLLLHEDRTFFVHPGVNPFALVRAASAALVGGAPQGASTITMQFARLLYELHTRTRGGQAAADGVRRVARDALLQTRDPRGAPQRDAVRRQRAGRRHREPCVLRQTVGTTRSARSDGTRADPAVAAAALTAPRRAGHAARGARTTATTLAAGPP